MNFIYTKSTVPLVDLCVGTTFHLPNNRDIVIRTDERDENDDIFCCFLSDGCLTTFPEDTEVIIVDCIVTAKEI